LLPPLLSLVTQSLQEAESWLPAALNLLFVPISYFLLPAQPVLRAVPDCRAFTHIPYIPSPWGMLILLMSIREHITSILPE